MRNGAVLARPSRLGAWFVSLTTFRVVLAPLEEFPLEERDAPSVPPMDRQTGAFPRHGWQRRAARKGVREEMLPRMGDSGWLCEL